jgi:hypothetical protein
MSINILQGGISKDERGQIRYVNEFDMSAVRRFYIIRNKDTKLIRGWRAHKIEQRWFYVISGSFEFKIIKIDNWDLPNPNLPIKTVILSELENKLINIPAGYGTAIKALEINSELLVYSDYGLEHADNDNYTWDLSYFLHD